jgi:hypothetical protein
VLGEDRRRHWSLPQFVRSWYATLLRFQFLIRILSNLFSLQFAPDVTQFSHPLVFNGQTASTAAAFPRTIITRTCAWKVSKKTKIHDANSFSSHSGPGEPTLDLPPTKIQPIQSSCKYLFKSHLYVRLSRNNKCTPLCEADILFDANEKQIAWLWIGSWSIAALLISSIALLCLILSSDVSWDRSLLPLVCVHCLSSVSWGIRILAGRNNTSCGYDSQFPGISLLLNDGLSTSPCSSTFLLRYYFGMCAASW